MTVSVIIRGEKTPCSHGADGADIIHKKINREEYFGRTKGTAFLLVKFTIKRKKSYQRWGNENYTLYKRKENRKYDAKVMCG